MIGQIAEGYRTPWRFVLAFPALIAIPIAIEMIQHIIEIRGGMYVDKAGAIAAESDTLRLGWGLFKTLALTGVTYWMARFMAGLDRSRVAALEPLAARLFAAVLLFQAVATALSMWGSTVLRALGVADAAMMPVGIGYMIVLLFLGLLLEPWKVAAALGNPAIGWSRSISMVAPILPWALAFTLVMMLPLMVLHYLAAFLAIGAAPIMVWALMIADALLVGYLAAVLATTSVLVARRAAERSATALA